MGRKTRNTGDNEEELDTSKLSEDGKLIIMVLEQKMEQLISKFTNEIKKRDEKIEMLEKEVIDLRQGVAKLSEKLDDADAYERRDTLIISGSAIPVATPGERVADLVCEMVRQKMKMTLSSTEISTAHRLGGRPKSQTEDKRNFIVKLCRRETKQEIISACKKTKPEGLFINENLTPLRNNIFHSLRRAKRKFPNIIAGCGSYDGKVHVYIRPPNPAAHMARNSKVSVNTQEQLIHFCKQTLKIEPSTLLDD